MMQHLVIKSRDVGPSRQTQTVVPDIIISYISYTYISGWKLELYGNGILELPITSLTEEFKSTKARLEMMGRTQKYSSMEHGAIERKQILKEWSGRSSSQLTWSKASETDRRKLVVEEIKRQEEAGRCGKAVSRSRASGGNGENVEKKKRSWMGKVFLREVWYMETGRIRLHFKAST